MAVGAAAGSAMSIAETLAVGVFSEAVYQVEICEKFKKQGRDFNMGIV